MRITSSQLIALLKRTVTEWVDDHASTQAASLAYFTLFSIAPILIIAIAVAGLIFGQDAAHGRLSHELSNLMGDTSAKALEELMASARRPKSGVIATLVGVVVLIFGATGVFAQLQESLNLIWKVKPRKMNGLLAWLRTRFLSFTMVLGIGFLLLVSLVVSAVLAAMSAYFEELVPGWPTVWQIINLFLSFGVVTVLFALIYKVLPDERVAWRDVWLGAAVTAFLFSVGKFGIGLYLGRSAVASSYGAAGSVAVLLIWVYYSAMILFLGAEFTQVYARTHGSLRAQGHPPFRS